ncbi:hypothetical protein DRQ26_02275 [bacterium]|nr:MAG: hypothetical protein DRQ26_02275 [bacterium]
MEKFSDIYRKLLELHDSGGEGILATVIEKQGSGPSRVGAKMLILPNGEYAGTVGGGSLERLTVRDALKLMEERKSAVKEYLLTENGDADEVSKTGMVCGGDVKIFFEYIAPLEEIFIFGAGHIGKALAYHLKNLPFKAFIVDIRKNADENLPGVSLLTYKRFVDFFEARKISSDSYFVICTSSHETDYQILREIYREKISAKYIGMLASKNKAKTLVERLKAEIGDKIDLQNLYTPIGLDIGGDSPDEIAIAIISEILSVKYGRSRTQKLSLKF